MKRVIIGIGIFLLIFVGVLLAQLGYLQRPQKISIENVDSIRVVEKWDIDIKIDKELTEEEKIHLIHEIESNKFYNRPITTFGPEIGYPDRYVFTFYSNSIQKYTVYINSNGGTRFFDGGESYYSRKVFNFETLKLE